MCGTEIVEGRENVGLNNCGNDEMSRCVIKEPGVRPIGSRKLEVLSIKKTTGSSSWPDRESGKFLWPDS